MRSFGLVDAGDAKLYVEDSGETGLQTVLCLHSLWMDNSMFDAFASELTGKYRVIRAEFRGQGRSSPATSEITTMDQCADDIDSLIDALKLADINVVAQSMGGDVALRIGARRPDLYRSMAILGSSARNEPKEMLDWASQWLIDTYKTGFKGEHLDTLAGIMFGETTLGDPDKRNMVDHWRNKMSALPTSLWPAIRGVLYRESVLDELNKLHFPVLVISGGEDHARPPAWSEEVANSVQNGRHINVLKSGHSVILEKPDVVIPEVVKFLNANNN